VETTALRRQYMNKAELVDKVAEATGKS